MNAEVFIDTNIFLYSISDQPQERGKADRARDLLLTEKWGWSVQVAGEFFYTATSPKRQFQLPIDQAVEYVKTTSDRTAHAFYRVARTGASATVQSELLGRCNNRRRR